MRIIPVSYTHLELGISAARYAKEMESIKLNEGLLVFTKNRKEFIEEDMHMEERVMGISESEGYRMDKYSMFSLLDMKKTGDINCKYILQRKPFQWSKMCIRDRPYTDQSLEVAIPPDLNLVRSQLYSIVLSGLFQVEFSKTKFVP